jgi:hypothetical protein
VLAGIARDAQGTDGTCNKADSVEPGAIKGRGNGKFAPTVSPPATAPRSIALASCLQPQTAVPTVESSPRLGIMGGASFYYLRPYLQNNTATVTTIDPATPMSRVVEDAFQ